MNNKTNVHKNRYRRLSGLLVVQVIVSLLLSGFVVYSVLFPPEVHSYVTTNNGAIIPLFPLNEPILSNQTVEDWASLRASAAFNLNFYNWQKQVAKLTPFFTKDGYVALNNAYQKSNLISALQNNKLVISSIVSKTPVILAQGVHNNHYMWKVSLPLLVTYTSANKMTKENLNVTMFIQRVPVMDQSAGIQINTFNVRRANGLLMGSGG